MTQHYTAYTLVDITNSNITSHKSHNDSGYNQQQNLNTLIQTIGLRSQPIDIKVSVLYAQDVVKYRFGNSFRGLHNVWKFDFASEHSDVYSNNNDNVYFLKKDCHRVAFTPFLDETVNFVNNIFDTVNEDTINIYFFKH